MVTLAPSGPSATSAIRPWAVIVVLRRFGLAYWALISLIRPLPFNQPRNMCLTPGGKTLLVADIRNFRVRGISLEDGRFTDKTLIGCGESGNKDGPALQCELSNP